MRLLHTSDWHLGSSLRGHDRTDELFRQVERVCEIAERESVDVLLVAGDVFEFRKRVDPAHEVTKRLSQVLSPHIRRGLRVVLLPGNHDDREHFQMMRELLELEHGCCERVRVVVKADIFEMAGVQFAALPYPVREVLERYGEQPSGGAMGAAERNKRLSAILAELVRDMTGLVKSDSPSVFATHINVEGVTAESGKEIGTYDQDINLALKALPLNVSYIALGHIHQQQQIKSHPVPCFYSGSFDRMDFGERNEEKGVLLVDIPERGPARVTPLPLETTPFYDLHVNRAEFDALAETYAADRERSFVRLTVERTADDGLDSLTIGSRAKKIFP
ncbi:MAG: exonuclease SbcCD subunit D, partial [Acidobacteriota bacterium]|nr:exonuclease SbcCD subunit D [Acidobacteriota bacterium]